MYVFSSETVSSKFSEKPNSQVLPLSYIDTAEDDGTMQQHRSLSPVQDDDETATMDGLLQTMTDGTVEMSIDEEKPIVALEKERLCMQSANDEEYVHLGHHHRQQLSSLSDLVSRHSIDSLDLQECSHTAEDPDDGNYPGSCLSAEDSGIHTEDMSSCVSQADDEERSNMQPSPVQQLQQKEEQQEQEQEQEHKHEHHRHVSDTYNMVSLL